MSVKLLTFEDGVVRIDGEELPGILSDLRVSGKVRFDEQSVDKASGKKKTPQGWEDADISLTLYLTTDGSGTCYDKLESLNGWFKKTDGKANPSIFTVANRHLLARGVRRVVFSRLDSAETTQTDEIRASLSFVEHNPPIVRQEQAQAKTPHPASWPKKRRKKPQLGRKSLKKSSAGTCHDRGPERPLQCGAAGSVAQSVS